MSFLEWFIMKRMNANTKRLEKAVMYPNREVEFLSLRLGDTSVEREVFSNGLKGNIRICTQEGQDILATYALYVRYSFLNGKLVLDPAYQNDEEVFAPFAHRLLLILKLFLSFSRDPILEYEEDSYEPVA
jgi:hypothetical protein